MAQKFNKGDVVKLTSGGPNITVEKYDREIGWDFNRESQEIVVCCWFDGEDSIQTRTFNQDALEKIN